MKLKDKVQSLPETPGVYFMKDKDKNIMYVGKSKTLKNRVSQYFLPSYNPSKKITRMIKFIDDIETIETDTELDALVLECKLIKKLQPIYNTLLKNDKKYAYLKISTNEDYPCLECVSDNDCNGLYFGPYTSIQKLENIVQVLNKYFKLRSCKGINKLKGCINNDLGFCMAPCKNKNEKEYSYSINKLIDTLNGSDKDLVNDFNKEIIESINTLNFEKASQFKENLDCIELILSRSEVINYMKSEKIIITSIDIDDIKKKAYIIKGKDIIYSEVVKKDFNEENLKDYFKQNFEEDYHVEKNKNYIEKTDLDMASTIYNYLKSKSKLDFI
ncbi:MAG: GIY-YIG nuclease family protein [Paraclostridium bifermentans]|uniref:GIY-YIG nuclease family protein n=1 Tax=Paraclostridium bifermentans TaxID=1490 RepID=UPI001D9FC2E5|nr:GIY-YIG nuclease family protein [Paraclostridium bifermentans]MBS6508079.1 GIY-YIG nuclease family protein [Paraclostridium bifermentans]